MLHPIRKDELLYHILYLTGGSLIPRLWTSRLVFVGYLLTSVLIIAHYNGNLKAATAAPKVTQKYTSLEDLVADEKTTFIINKGSAIRGQLEVRLEADMSVS